MLWSKQAKSKKVAVCDHAAALPRWDRMKDIGKDGSAVRLFCPRCDTFVIRSD